MVTAMATVAMAHLMKTIEGIGSTSNKNEAELSVSFFSAGKVIRFCGGVV